MIIEKCGKEREVINKFLDDKIDENKSNKPKKNE